MWQKCFKISIPDKDPGSVFKGPHHKDKSLCGLLKILQSKSKHKNIKNKLILFKLINVSFTVILTQSKKLTLPTSGTQHS